MQNFLLINITKEPVPDKMIKSGLELEIKWVLPVLEEESIKVFCNGKIKRPFAFLYRISYYYSLPFPNQRSVALIFTRTENLLLLC
jgi:hypothetical protein